MLIRYKQHLIEIYDSIEVLPIDRFQMYNMKVLIDAGIGADLNGFNSRMSNILQLIDKDVESAKKELTNLHQNVLLTISKQNPRMQSFVILIKSIDGKKIETEDLTNDGINAIIEQLSKKALPYVIVKNALEKVKKKLIMNLKRTFQKRQGTQRFWSITES